MGYALAQICPNQRRAKSKIAFGDVYLNKKEVKNKWKKIALLVLVTLATALHYWSTRTVIQ